MTPGKPRILCVDDNDDTCFILRALLEKAGYQVSTAGSLSDALGLAGRDSFDLYILDNRFTDGSGLDLCRRIHELAPQTPIIFYSGAMYESDMKEGFGAGAQAYVSKPDIDQLLKTVGRCLSASESTPGALQ